MRCHACLYYIYTRLVSNLRICYSFLPTLVSEDIVNNRIEERELCNAYLPVDLNSADL